MLLGCRWTWIRETKSHQQARRPGLQVLDCLYRINVFSLVDISWIKSLFLMLNVSPVQQFRRSKPLHSTSLYSILFHSSLKVGLRSLDQNVNYVARCWPCQYSVVIESVYVKSSRIGTEFNNEWQDETERASAQSCKEVENHQKASQGCIRARQSKVRKQGSNIRLLWAMNTSNYYMHPW